MANSQSDLRLSFPFFFSAAILVSTPSPTSQTKHSAILDVWTCCKFRRQLNYWVLLLFLNIVLFVYVSVCFSFVFDLTTITVWQTSHDKFFHIRHKNLKVKVLCRWKVSAIIYIHSILWRCKECPHPNGYRQDHESASSGSFLWRRLARKEI